MAVDGCAERVEGVSKEGNKAISAAFLISEVKQDDHICKNFWSPSKSQLWRNMR